MDLIEFIQKEGKKIYRKKFSKKYINYKILPIVNYINSSEEKKFLIGGSQGIGKSSLICLIKRVLETFYNKKVLSLSLDDYYLSKKKRQLLSKNKHKLLAIRGVPGTHDTNKLIRDINKFSQNKYPIKTPIFDKLTDDILSKEKLYKKKCDVLIFEGWCCGCTPIKKKYLYKNINKIEIKHDKSFEWRDYYNNKLANEYYDIFNLFNKKIFIKAPSFKYILDWRIKQEKRNVSLSKKSRRMTGKEIKIFLQYYEKITKWMLKTSKKESDLIINVNKNQEINTIIIN
tara:strand:+ start:32 stop:889 length:858 start_codon:yes stop_codon:yes gene_type:complete